MTGRCACGRETRDQAYGCEECADELSRTLGDTPWINEQLDITITGQRGKRPGANGRASDGLPWNDKAAKIQHALRNHLVTTVRLCETEHIRHQSPYAGLPVDDLVAMSQWLLWRVDGLALNQAFTDILRTALQIQKNALHAIDRQPDRMFLGMCELARYGVCAGAVYITTGQTIGKCRECGMTYDPEARRASLEQALDDKLMTAAEIAIAATHLGIPAARDIVRNRVNQWHSRGRLAAAPGEGDPRFRYGDVVPLLSALYDTKGA